MRVRFITDVLLDHYGRKYEPRRELVDWAEYSGGEEYPVYGDWETPPVPLYNKGQELFCSESTAAKYIAKGWAEKV